MISFDDIIGQAGAKSHLLAAVRDNKISHAYIFSGEDGSGKMMLAERFAATLQCDNPVDGPCCMCINCMQSESHNHPDIIYITHEKKNIVVDDIRNQLINDIAIKPYSGRYKIYIIDEAEKMNEAAQNALLKTLEEPPEYAVIILLATNTGAFLQTILSRCVVLELKPIKTELISDYLMQKYHLPDYVARLCASFSCGCIGKAIRYATDETFIQNRDRVIKLVENAHSMSAIEISDVITALSEKDKQAYTDDYFDLLELWFRDVLVFKSTGNRNRIIFSEELPDIQRQSEVYSYERINNILKAIQVTRERISAYVSFDAAMQLLISAIID